MSSVILPTSSGFSRAAPVNFVHGAKITEIRGYIILAASIFYVFIQPQEFYNFIIKKACAFSGKNQQ